MKKPENIMPLPPSESLTLMLQLLEEQKRRYREMYGVGPRECFTFDSGGPRTATEMSRLNRWPQ